MYPTMVLTAVADERMSQAIHHADLRRLRRDLRGGLRVNAARHLVRAAHRLDPEVDEQVAEVHALTHGPAATGRRAA